ncbi:MAG: YggT family protein [Acidimicrobiales bacterium]
MTVLDIIAYVIEAYVLVLIARALLSWIPARPGTPLHSVVRALDVVTEPVLRPVRRILPTFRAGGIGIDLSIIVVVVIGEIVASFLLRG